MGKYNRHLCPLCGNVLKILEANIMNVNFVKIKVTCESTDCPFYNVYKLGVEVIRDHGVPQS